MTLGAARRTMEAMCRPHHPNRGWLGPPTTILAILVVAGAGAPSGAAQKLHSAEELFQPFLEGELSQWLIGPIGRLATEPEIDAYLRLKTAEEAKQFIDAFWAARDPDPAKDGNAVLELYENRAVEADKKFSEAAVVGRRTDRGTIHVLYGAPESVDYEEFRDVSGPDVERWRYPKKAQGRARRSPSRKGVPLRQARRSHQVLRRARDGRVPTADAGVLAALPAERTRRAGRAQPRAPRRTVAARSESDSWVRDHAPPPAAPTSHWCCGSAASWRGCGRTVSPPWPGTPAA